MLLYEVTLNTFVFDFSTPELHCKYFLAVGKAINRAINPNRAVALNRNNQ